ncbi:MAG: hypothetical protein CFE21_16510 [Bacteroidetes bacterium B1(2017)]|nr:MAG: hypothetical protein CFE21_16510 [Bacteroidetes bacterium B1(2017)]
MYEEIGTGYGLGFEYFFGKNSAVQIPVIYFSEGGIKGLVSSLGLKLYPYGYKKIFSWSIGSNVKFGRIRVANFHEYNYNKITYKGNVVTNILGFDLQNTLKVRMKRLYFEFGNSFGMTHAKENSLFINSNFGIGFNFR